VKWGELLKGIFIIAPLILVVSLGMALRSVGFLGVDDRDRFAKLLYWIAIPILLFRLVYLSGENIFQYRNLFLASYASFFIVHAMGLAASYLLHPNDKEVYAFTAMASTRSNCFYLGIPAAALALGDTGVGAASAYLAIALPGYNLITVMWGEAALSGGVSMAALRRASVRIIKNPMIISCFLGLAAAMLGIRVPSAVLESFKLVSEMATGIALISLGLSLELSDLPAALRRTWLDAVFKLVINPAVVWALFLIWPVQEIMFQASMIVTAMPIAVNTFILAGGMGMDERYACESVASSTVLAPVSIAAWFAILGIS
jgi:predicted permease